MKSLKLKITSDSDTMVFVQILKINGNFHSTDHIKVVEDSILDFSLRSDCIVIDRSPTFPCFSAKFDFDQKKARDAYVKDLIRWISNEQFPANTKPEINGKIYTWEIK